MRNEIQTEAAGGAKNKEGKFDRKMGVCEGLSVSTDPPSPKTMPMSQNNFFFQILMLSGLRTSASFLETKRLNNNGM